MLILLFVLLGKLARNVMQPLAVIIVILAGIVLIFGSVGMSISAGLGASVVGGLFKAITRAARYIVHVLERIARRVFNGTRNALRNRGLAEGWASFLAGMITAVVTLVII